ncbi:glycosyltransferase family 2 protein [Reyranella sp.]|uniref:glycosyltransferase family 2 protein n=1 Tax=Reyranella sp. TaxID=1929291 RepID=UPI00271FBADB|nr:glycosyltransferase family 2 protein [Reyranella sp.]MDO8973673.1 glycosyltransferase family 2 protein [Reyranella sp.]
MSDISVVIPTFNRLWALPQAVESCRSTGGNVEIVVVDDGSTDGTWDWLQAQRDIVAIRAENWGKDWAVETALQAARGEFVRFLDSDDWLCEDANVCQLALARETGADLVVAGYEDYDDETGERRVNAWDDCDDFIAQQLGEGWSSHYSAFLFRRDLIRGIPHRQDFALRDDRLFILEVAMRHPRLAIYREPAFVHRRHAGERLQHTSGFRRDLGFWTHISIYRKTLGLLEARGELTLRRKRAAIRMLWPNVRAFARAYPREAAEILDWIYRLDPEFKPPVRPAIAFAYKWLGFAATERLLGFRALQR